MLRSVLSWCVVHSVRSSQSEGRTSLNDVSAVVRRKEGRTDSHLYLSLINLSDGVEKCLYLINKRDTAYAFPHKLSSGLSEEMWGGSHILWMEDVQWSWDKTGSAIRESRVLLSPVCNGQSSWELSKIFICCEVFGLPGFPLKVVSCRSGSTQKDLDRPNHKIRIEYNCKGVATILPNTFSVNGVPGLKPSIQRVNILPRCP